MENTFAKTPLFVSGGGKLSDNDLNNIADKIKPIEIDGVVGYPVRFIPTEISFQKKLSRAVYDVAADFDAEGKQSLLQQFKQLLLT